MICVRRKTADGANELGLRFPVRLVDASTLRARSTSVARIYRLKGHTSERGLIGEKRTQLKERPAMQMCTLSFPNRYPSADSAQIFDGDAALGVLGFTYDLLADAMIRVTVEPLLLSSKFLQMSLGAPCSFGLKPSTKFSDARSFGKRFFAAIWLVVRVVGEIPDPKVDAKPTSGTSHGRCLDFNRHEEEEATVAVYEIGLTALAGKSFSVSRSHGARQNQSTIEDSQPNAVVSFFEGVTPLIKSDRAKETKDRPLCFVSSVCLHHFPDSAYSVLRRKAKLLANFAVESLVQFDLTPNFRIERLNRQPRRSFVHLLCCCEKSLPFLGGDEKFYHRYKLHRRSHHLIRKKLG
jgi:hypothetical protein